MNRLAKAYFIACERRLALADWLLEQQRAKRAHVYFWEPDAAERIQGCLDAEKEVALAEAEYAAQQERTG